MSSFQERQKSLFNHLMEAEKQHNFSKDNSDISSSNYGVIDRQTYRKVKSEMKQFRGRESIFKRPEAPISLCLKAKKVPDYIKNPKKWVYYSLSDVTPDQMSDATNTATALALLQELEEHEIAKTKIDNDVDSDTVIKKPTFLSSAIIKKAPKDTEKITFKDRKVIMPEYIIGEKKNKRNKVLIKEIKHTEETAKKNDLKLDHLYED